MKENAHLRRMVLLVLSLFEVFLFALALMWLLSDPGFEPAISSGGLFLSILGTVLALEKTVQATIEMSQEHRVAALRLLNELWAYINRERLEDVISRVNNRTLPYSVYINSIGKYLELRQARQDKHFVNQEIESAFAEFDKKMSAFDSQLWAHHDIMTIVGREKLVPHYKLPEVKPNHHLTEEAYHYKLREHEKVLELGNEVLKEHDNLVDVARHILPEFTFPVTWNEG